MRLLSFILNHYFCYVQVLASVMSKKAKKPNYLVIIVVFSDRLNQASKHIALSNLLSLYKRLFKNSVPDLCAYIDSE